MSDPLPPDVSKESDIPESVKRARAILNGTAAVSEQAAPRPKRNRQQASSTPPAPTTRNIMQVTIDGADFNLVMPCSGVDVKPVQGRDSNTETLALGSDRYALTRFTPKMGAKFRITQHATGITYDVTFIGFSFDVGDTIVHAFVVDAKNPSGQP